MARIGPTTSLFLEDKLHEGDVEIVSDILVALLLADQVVYEDQVKGEGQNERNHK